MPYNTYVIPHAVLERFKQQAKKLKRETGVPHHQALDIVAQAKGFNHWHHVIESVKLTTETEQAFYSGLVIAMDVKDAQDFDLSQGAFVEDEIVPNLVLDDFIESAKTQNDEAGGKLSDQMSDDEIEQMVTEDMWNYTFFRFTGKKLPSDIESVVRLVSESSFWPPLFVWLRGEFYNTYHIPAIDDDDNIVGVRF